jgi:hypothetical protein
LLEAKKIIGSFFLMICNLAELNGNVVFGRKFLGRIDLGRKLNGPNG